MTHVHKYGEWLPLPEGDELGDEIRYCGCKHYQTHFGHSESRGPLSDEPRETTKEKFVELRERFIHLYDHAHLTTPPEGVDALNGFTLFLDDKGFFGDEPRELEWRRRPPADYGEWYVSGRWDIYKDDGEEGFRLHIEGVSEMPDDSAIVARGLTVPAAKSLAASLQSILDGRPL